MMNKEITIAGAKIMYRVTGHGKPVLLVHGFGETGSTWHHQVAFLEQQFRLIVPDLPGSGASDIINEMSMEGMAGVLKSILDAEAISACIIIGHSMGGYITLAFAEKYSSHVIAFGLFHSTAYADSEEKKAARRKGIAFINEHGAFPFLKNASPALFSPLTKDENPELIDGFIAGLSNFSAQALVSYYEAMIQRPDRTEVLRKAHYPILFITGKHDTAIPPEDGLKLCQLPEKAYFYTLSDSGHMGMLEEQEKSNHILLHFLTEAEEV